MVGRPIDKNFKILAQRAALRRRPSAVALRFPGDLTVQPTDFSVHNMNMVGILQFWRSR